jgi:hydrogenase maturation protease
MSVLVLGIGHPDCGDDAIGPQVAAALAQTVPDGVTVQSRAGDMLALIEDWAGHESVLLIDAAAACGHPGRIYRVDLRAAPLPQDLAPASTHAFGLAAAVALAATLDRLPRRLVLLAVEGQVFTPGQAMSPAVSAAADAVIKLARDEIARFLAA